MKRRSPHSIWMWDSKKSQSQQSKFAHANSFYSAMKMAQHMFEKWQAWSKQKAADGGLIFI